MPDAELDAELDAESVAEPSAAVVEAAADEGILKSRAAEILLANSPGDERGGAFSNWFVKAFIDMSVYIGERIFSRLTACSTCV